MGIRSTAGKQLGKRLLPRAESVAPGLTDSFVREALSRAIDGVGPLPGAAAAAEAKLAAADGDRDRAVRNVLERHVQYAGAQGFATNIGGLVTAAVTIPANIAGLAVIQCRMIAVIAHLRGYDLDDPRVRNAVLTCLIGEESVRKLVRKRRIPAPPMALATAPHHDPDLDHTLSAEVAAELITRVAGKRIATTVGGVVGGGTDAWATWQIGRYASRELLPRARR